MTKSESSGRGEGCEGEGAPDGRAEETGGGATEERIGVGMGGEEVEELDICGEGEVEVGCDGGAETGAGVGGWEAGVVTVQTALGTGGLADLHAAVGAELEACAAAGGRGADVEEAGTTGAGGGGLGLAGGGGEGLEICDGAMVATGLGAGTAPTLLDACGWARSEAG